MKSKTPLRKLPKNKRSSVTAPDYRESLETTIFQEAQTFVSGSNYSTLELIASAQDIEVFRDDRGNYILDRAISTDTRKFSASDFGSYDVQHQRQIVSQKFALQCLLEAAIPDELVTFLPREWIHRLLKS